MAEAPMPNPTWTDADTDALFATVGRYLVIFQWVEGKLDQILLLGWGYENWADRQAELATMSNFEKVIAVKELVLNSHEFARIHSRPEWCTSFELMIQRLHNERSHRNHLVHSQYLFEFTNAGLLPLRSRRKKVAGDATFEQQYLTKAAQETLLCHLTQLASDLNFVHLQLIHDYKVTTNSTSPSNASG